MRKKKRLNDLFDSALFDCLHELQLQRLNVKILYAKNTLQNTLCLLISAQ